MSNTDYKVNAYVCDKLHITTTYDYDKGTTPFMMRCRICDNNAKSQFYQVEDTVKINGLWHIPCKEEYDDLEHFARKHVDMGGLVFKYLGTNDSKLPTKVDIESYRDWARNNHVKGDVLPAGVHPIVTMECQKMNEEPDVKS